MVYINKINGGLQKKKIFKYSKQYNPLVTIITVVKNNRKYLESTIKSIIRQSYKNLELIIIDGNSTDGSLKIIKKYDKLNLVDYWVSENDLGIYDAFNKGLLSARGELIGFVNSDDILLKDALKILVNYYNKNKDFDFIFGSVKKHWGTLYGYKPWKIKFTWGFYSSHSTGFFIKKEAAKIVGPYNIRYKLSADYDYFYRMIVKKKLKGISSRKDELFGIFRRGGFSSKVKFFDHLVECTKIRLDNGQNKFMVLLTFIIKFIFNLKRL
jgi:glycosyltransferase involved in cell wall biosynthesis